MVIQTSPAVRIKPPSFLTGNVWLAEDFLRRRRFSLPAPAVLLLIACMRAQERKRAVQDVADRLNLSGRSVEQVADSLFDKELLVHSVSEDMQWFEQVRNDWASSNWVEAAEYHLLTYDYQFLDADVNGVDNTRQRMQDYGKAEPDLNRYKRYSEALDRVPLPEPSVDLLPVSIRDGRTDQNGSGALLNKDTLGAILAMAFGQVGTLKIHWSGEPTVFRTSPSGGSRHPTEAYVVAIDVPGIEPGWYHVSVQPPEMELLRRDGTNRDDLMELFPSTYGRAPFPVGAIVILTSLFERNMYRYREPRTFRTIHMDAGHLADTVELIAEALGLRALVQYVANERSIEQRLSLHGLEEGYQLSVALGPGLGKKEV